MKWPRRAVSLVVLASVLGAILVALAVVQVHWTNQVSDANRERLRANMRSSVERFRLDFYLQLLRVCRAFEPPLDTSLPEALKFYAARYDDWRGASARPGLVAGVALWGPDGRQLMRLNPETHRFEPEPWPVALEKVVRDLQGRRATSARVGPQAADWTLDERAAVLCHPFTPDSLSLQPVTASLDSPAAGGVIIQLNRDFIWQTLTPELAARYFRGPGTPNYRVAILSTEPPSQVLYESASESAAGQSPSSGDVAVNLVPGSLDALRAAAGDAEPDTGQAPSPETTAAGNLEASTGTRGARLETLPGSEGAWRLVVRYRTGSVEEAVQGLRRRNLAVSLGILLLLAITVALLVVSAQRAHQLAESQINFVAGVSHELRTPLAVICSAAENLADGVVAVPGDVKRYGALIRDHGRRLSDMVGQVLLLAAGRSGRLSRRREPVDVAAAVETALTNLQVELESHRVAVEKHVRPELPRVLGDPAALAQCIQNLISNGIRYGGPRGELQIRVETSEPPEEVRIAVEDHGIGIEPDDLARIFEPFYRGKNGARVQERGTGLGLSLAKQMAEAMGGRLTVQSTVGKGSCFTLCLPAMTRDQRS